MKRLMFSVTFSLFLAVQSVLHHACSSQVVERFGTAVYDLLRHNMYMNDVHLGGASVANVIAQPRMLVNVLALAVGGVNFASNSVEVMNAIPKEFRYSSMTLDLDKNDFGEASSLGLKWQTVDDVFYCKASSFLLIADSLIIKRSILSKISSVFNVFGVLAGLRAKILLQILWKLNVDCNEPFDNDVAKRYKSWVAELIDIRL